MGAKQGAVFASKISEHDNCLCSACHDTGRVMKVKLPKTLFHDGKKLSTKYSEYWLCDRCKRNLSDALENMVVET